MFLIKNSLEPDFNDRAGDGHEGKDYGYGSPGQQLSDVINVSKDIRKTVVNLEPELEIRFERCLNDESKGHWERKLEIKSMQREKKLSRFRNKSPNSFKSS